MKGMKKLTRKRSKKSRSFILSLALVALLGYFIITLIYLQTDISNKKQELELINKQYQTQEIKNQEYNEIIKNGENSQYIERVARDVLGYVLPGERVYCNTSTGK